MVLLVHVTSMVRTRPVGGRNLVVRRTRGESGVRRYRDGRGGGSEWEWFDTQLAHPDGRARGGEPRVMCDELIPANAPLEAA